MEVKQRRRGQQRGREFTFSEIGRHSGGWYHEEKRRRKWSTLGNAKKSSKIRTEEKLLNLATWGLLVSLTRTDCRGRVRNPVRVG